MDSGCGHMAGFSENYDKPLGSITAANIAII